MMKLTSLSPTGIGSVPFEEPREAVRIILETCPEIPFWPQLVRLGFREEMVAQGVAGLPGLKLDVTGRQVRLDPEVPREIALAEFYETIWSGTLEPFALSPEEARGFYALVEAVQDSRQPPLALKGQVVGPVTFAGMVKDHSGKAILYDPEFRQAVALGLARKAAWQAEQFRRLGFEAVIFFDEPILTGFGSAFLPVSRAEVQELLTSAVEAAKETGPLWVGVHCCGNTDWALLLETPIEILSFDSYGFFDHLLLYLEALQKFLARGGYLAWGLVPTGEELAKETEDSLWDRFVSQVQQLAAQGLEVRTVLERALLTPACGLGYLKPDAARQALQFLSALSRRGRGWLTAL